MNKTINITVKDKIAVANDVLYICGNSDFIVNFDFDAEWNEFDTKTARFIHGYQYHDVVFQGNQCAMPVIANTHKIYVGVFAGNLKTTTSAIVMAKKSILCGTGSPAAPSDDVYNQIMELIKNMNGVNPEAIDSAVKEYLKDNPISGEVSEEQIAEAVQNYMDENPIEVEVPDEKVEQAVEEYLNENPIEGGSGGGSSEWELIKEVTTTEDVSSLTIDKDANGNSFDLIEVEVTVHFPSTFNGGTLYLYFMPGTTNYYMPGFEAGENVHFVKYNALSGIGIVSSYNHTKYKGWITHYQLYGRQITQFRVVNWSGVALPSGSVVRVVGRRK